MKNTLKIIFVLFLTIGSGILYANDDKRYQGLPTFHAQMTRRFVIWETNDVFHVRTTTLAALNKFTGVIYAHNGTFSDVKAIRLDKGDFVRLSTDKKRIYFYFATWKGVDGFNFKTNAGLLYFSLQINGRKANDKLEIFLGDKGVHPLDNPFLCFVKGKQGSDAEAAKMTVDEKPDGNDVTALVPENELEKDSKTSD